MKRLLFIFLMLTGCTSFHSNWVTSTYGLTPHNKKQYGYIKSGHEYKPVLNVGDNIYLKFDTPMAQKDNLSNSSCDNGYRSIVVWIWSKEDIFINREKILIINKGSIVSVDKVDVWRNGEFIPLNASDAIEVIGNDSVGDTLVTLWENNKIPQLVKSQGLNYYNFYLNLNSPIICSDDFELTLKYKNTPDSLEMVMPTIYFTPTEYQRFHK
ncbi:hypothetical protein Sden_2060 [Shewanella denitrificans OS217]|jgi:hypothetical protein|uniref:Lipoprotein n=1 Tax=Shewanella denitrificans (strain OS217 / ATCC BAA-1090 / DSM 15013) TaxID=318161 RepID=Q12MI4_SHEDO|nr:hypothetical protein [Shewanella denitrificans]ABE55342.1 hypothetical protein Sden_2060 [Shewanella denitrificans OS217]